ncbi:hypothetical protein [Synechococcus sp. CS-1326]|uniref:hypothetical protein n=1 Tax=Synechococcus sp. CS-1326 TaxID=2847978 RepID=UPI00223A76A1|nr:hypothetical protein [Synechococcus sp. CS-1326]
MTPDSHRPRLGKGALWGAPELVAEGVEALRDAAPHQDEDGTPCFRGDGPAPRASRRGVATRFPHQTLPPRASVAEVERRIAEAQLWIAQRLPLSLVRANAANSWGVSNTRTINRYLDLGRKRMVAELINNRLEHQAQHIYALYDCARRAMDADQFSAAVGALRVIAEIGGLLRAPIKPPEAK